MIGWLDLSAGVSGDLLLGALVDAGVPVEVMQSAVEPLGLGISYAVEQVTRCGLAATQVTVLLPSPDSPTSPDSPSRPDSPTSPDSPTRKGIQLRAAAATTPEGGSNFGEGKGFGEGRGAAEGEPHDEPHRSWRDVRVLLAALPAPLRTNAEAVFSTLATAEARVHGIAPDDVHFHEVGALDAIADVVGVVAGFQHLGLERLSATRIGLGSGTARTQHGMLPVPTPAVLALLEGCPVAQGPAAFESTTPTGAALVATLVDEWAPLPPLTLARTGVGAATMDPTTHPNVTRLLLGIPSTAALLLETNVDDLEPRLWPAVLQRLLDAGASDAWLTPILMKKGRPAHTLSVLVEPASATAVRAVVFTETTTLGLREQEVGKHALERSVTEVVVRGERIRVKHGWYGGRLVTSQPEWDDVARAADALGLPLKTVLAEAQTSAKNASAPSPPASGTPTQS